jgi:hypothetical protein
MPEETVDLNGEDSKHPESRNRRTDQNKRKSQDRRNRKRMKQLSAGTEATHEAEGAKKRGAAASSIEFAHEPNPLYPATDGDARTLEDNDSLAHEAPNTEAIRLSAQMSVSADEISLTSEIVADIRAETTSPGQFSRPRKSKSARIDDTIPMAMAATDVAISDDAPISQAGLEKAEVGSAEVVRVESGSRDEEPSSAADPYARPRGFKSARIGSTETIFQITIPAAPVTFNVLLSGDAGSARQDVGWT